MLRTSRAVMLLFLAVAAVLQHTVSSTRLPHLRIESADDLRGQVCYRSASNVQKALQEELTLKNLNDYPKKPSTGIKICNMAIKQLYFLHSIS